MSYDIQGLPQPKWFYDTLELALKKKKSQLLLIGLKKPTLLLSTLQLFYEQTQYFSSRAVCPKVLPMINLICFSKGAEQLKVPFHTIHRAKQDPVITVALLVSLKTMCQPLPYPNPHFSEVNNWCVTLQLHRTIHKVSTREKAHRMQLGLFQLKLISSSKQV